MCGRRYADELGVHGLAGIGVRLSVFGLGRIADPSVANRYGGGKEIGRARGPGDCSNSEPESRRPDTEGRCFLELH